SAYFLSGLFLGLAFDLRPQTIFFSFGLFLVVLFERKWKEMITLILGAAIPVILVQGTIDYFIWGKPFVELIGYVKGNILSAKDYITLPWYNYFLVIFGILVPPISFMLFFGFLKTWKKYLLIFIPVAVFFIFHSYFPNKQERFIMPILPFIVITGVIGWNELIDRSRFWASHARLLRGFWIFFWIMNISFMIPVSMVYSKRARVEAMVYLSKYKDIKSILVADSDNNPELFPRFYLGQWPVIYDFYIGNENTMKMIERVTKKEPANKQPRFILFTGGKLSPETVIQARKSFPFLVYEKTIEPGNVDQVMHWLNPINKSRYVFIYRNKALIPEKAP
ncbi:MAG: hypothetical protein ABSD71_09440, partial [Bacteroidales bacterium]